MRWMMPRLTKINTESFLPYMPAKSKDAPDSELRSLLIVYGWKPHKEGAATWLMRIMERLDRADNPPATPCERTPPAKGAAVERSPPRLKPDRFPDGIPVEGLIP